MVQKFPGIPVKARKRNTSEGINFFAKTFHRNEPFHLNSPRSPRNYPVFRKNGKRSTLAISMAAETDNLANFVHFLPLPLPPADGMSDEHPSRASLPQGSMTQRHTTPTSLFFPPAFTSSKSSCSFEKKT